MLCFSTILCFSTMRYCVSQQWAIVFLNNKILCFSTTLNFAGNLPVKRKSIHVNAEGAGVQKGTELEWGGHFAQHKIIYASIWSKLLFLGWHLRGETQNWCPEVRKMGVNGVAVAPHGPILCEDEATPSRKPFKYLPRPFWALPDQNIIKNIEKLKKPKKPYMFI